MIQDSRRSKTAAQLSPTMKGYLSGVYYTESYLCGLPSFCILRFPGYFFSIHLQFKYYLSHFCLKDKQEQGLSKL